MAVAWSTQSAISSQKMEGKVYKKRVWKMNKFKSIRSWI